jgi:hypothetical protein
MTYVPDIAQGLLFQMRKPSMSHLYKMVIYSHLYLAFVLDMDVYYCLAVELKYAYSGAIIQCVTKSVVTTPFWPTGKFIQPFPYIKTTEYTTEAPFERTRERHGTFFFGT